MHKHEPLRPASTPPRRNPAAWKAERADDYQARAQAQLYNTAPLTLAGGKPNRTLRRHHTVPSVRHPEDRLRREVHLLYAPPSTKEQSFAPLASPQHVLPGGIPRGLIRLHPLLRRGNPPTHRTPGVDSSVPPVKSPGCFNKTRDQHFIRVSCRRRASSYE
jgi:hypothetical protein